MELVLVPLALLGHAFLWAAFFNHTHGAALPRWFLDPLTLVALALTVLIPVAFGGWFPTHGLDVVGGHGVLGVWLARLYLGLCWIAAATTIARWLRYRVFRHPPTLLRHDRSRLLKLVEPSSHSHHFLARLPGNQILQLDITERALEVPRLAAALDRITILHLSDLHFTGRVGKAYFEEVVRLANQFLPDLVAITGDLVDKPECIDWIPD
ncbi:metallophosphoesterase, partial [Planctomycetota bacterium]